MKTAIFAFIFALTGCLADGPDDSDQSEASSALTGTVTCTGIGFGTCTASSSPSGWTISIGRVQSIYSTGPTTAHWACDGGAPRTVTAVGVGTTLVTCSHF